MDTNRQFWDGFSKHYTGFMGRSQGTYQQLCQTLRPFLKRDMDVLELACGTGQLSVPLSPCVRSWEATDFSAEMIRQAEKQVYSSRLHFSVQDATRLPYGPESFDGVVISNALHVMPHPEKALAEAWRVLKPGGMAVRPHLCLGQKQQRQIPPLGLGAVGVSGVPPLECRRAHRLSVRERLCRGLPSGSGQSSGAPLLPGCQKGHGKM